MTARSTDEVKRDLESERERLSHAVRALRSGVDTARRRLPFLAVGAAGAGLILHTASKRVFHRNAAGREKRARFSLPDRG